MPTYTTEYIRDLEELCKEISSINSEIITALQNVVALQQKKLELESKLEALKQQVY